jgi:lipopolysaccharide transport system ATP-binding protein
MSKIIKVENIGKKYLISHKGREQYSTLRDTISEKYKKIFVPPSKNSPILPKSEEFWALKNISFEVEQGSRIGIIGKNGAGKSTLLKLLSRITEPSLGKITLYGKVASLLEIGTGFHPELSGRENIFLNGAVLGMSRKEIIKKFDEIVEFAEVEKFLDTPVKRYSSGMYVRLAFAVASYLEPDILIVDEVLAVGDAQFQKKSLGRMEEASQKQGRTVLFVSHNMGAIEQICNRVLLLEQGQIKEDSNDISKVVKNYLFSGVNDSNRSIWINTNNIFNNQWFKPLKMYIGNNDNDILEMPAENNIDFWLYIEGEVDETDSSLNIGYTVYDERGSVIYLSTHTDSVDKYKVLKEGKYIFKSKIPRRFLNEGIYKIELMASLHRRQWILEPSKESPYIFLNIRGGLSDSPMWYEKRSGAIAPVFNWEVIKK